LISQNEVSGPLLWLLVQSREFPHDDEQFTERRNICCAVMIGETLTTNNTNLTNEERCIRRADARNCLRSGKCRPAGYNLIELSRFAVGIHRGAAAGFDLWCFNPRRLPPGGFWAVGSSSV